MYRRFFRTLNYSSVNEDWRTESRALQLAGSDDRVLCVTGSGDRPLNLLATAPVAVTAIDCNPAQNHLLRLKVVAMERLPFGEYAAFLGLRPAGARWRRRIWDGLAPTLPDTARWFWQRQRRAIEKGVLYQGRFERHLWRAAALARLIRPRATRALFAFDDLDAQRRFVRQHWDTAGWLLTYRVVCSPLLSRLLFGDPAYFAHTALPVGRYLYERMQGALMRWLARESFMVSLVLRGRLSPFDLPPYLTLEGYEQIRARLHLLQVVDCDLVEYLRDPATRPFSRFSLSDVPSFLTEVGFERLLAAVFRRATVGARVVIRQFLTRHQIPGRLATQIAREPELEARLATEDRAFAYQFIVGEVHGVG